MADDDLFVNVNLDDVDDGLDPMPDGQTTCRVHSLTKKHKDGSEFPYIEVILKPAGDVDPNLEKFSNRNLWLNLSFNPKALWNMKLFAKACGVAWTPQGADLRQCRDKLVSVNVQTEPSRNDPERKINTVNTPYHAVR